jgi:hypothetical protein
VEVWVYLFWLRLFSAHPVLPDVCALYAMLSSQTNTELGHPERHNAIEVRESLHASNHNAIIAFYSYLVFNDL